MKSQLRIMSKQCFDLIDDKYKGEKGDKNTLHAGYVTGGQFNTCIEGEDFEVVVIDKDVTPLMPANNLRHLFISKLSDLFRFKGFSATGVKFLADTAGKSLSFELRTHNCADDVHGLVKDCVDTLLKIGFSFNFETIEPASHYCFVGINKD